METKNQGKKPGLAKKKVLFHQDNAPNHKTVSGMAKIYERKFEVMPHEPCSLNLAPSDFTLFLNFKKHATTAYFTDLNENAYRAIQTLEYR